LAKSAQDASARLFLCLYIKRFGEITTQGIIGECRDKSFTIIINQYGIEKRINYHELEDVFESKVTMVENKDAMSATIHFVLPIENPEEKDKNKENKENENEKKSHLQLFKQSISCTQ